LVTREKCPSLDESPKNPDELLRPKQIEKETNTSWKTVRRARPDKVVHIGIRAVAMRRGDALRPVNRNR
jgi:hypothetical protein